MIATEKDPRVVRWGQALQRLLDEKGMTPVELADRADSTKSSVYRYLSGEVAPQMINLHKLARALGMTPGELYDLK